MAAKPSNPPLINMIDEGSGTVAIGSVDEVVIHVYVRIRLQSKRTPRILNFVTDLTATKNKNSICFPNSSKCLASRQIDFPHSRSVD